MGCCFPRMMSPENIIKDDDGHLMFTMVTGGITIVRGNVQQNLPGGTLFVTDKKLIHCTRCFGCHRLEFKLTKLRDLDSSLTFAGNCHVSVPCCTSLPDSYLIFKAKLDRKIHHIGIKLKNSDDVFHRVEKLIKKYKIRLSIIEEEGKDISKSKLESSASEQGTTHIEMD